LSHLSLPTCLKNEVGFLARIKVLHAITLSELGGAQKVVYHLAAGLPPDRFEVAVACAPGGGLVNWLKDLSGGIQVFEIPELKRNISPVSDLKAFWKLFVLMKAGKFDIVHCHSSKAGFLGRMAAKMAGVPKIYFTVHGWGINDYQSRPVRFIYTWAERLAGSVSTGIVCVSESDLLKGRNLGLAAPGKLSVIYNGLLEPGWREGVLRQELKIRKEDILIGTVARMAPQKDPLFFLEIARRMLTTGGGSVSGGGRVYFVLVGDGPLKLECENFINNQGLKERVFLLGAREDAPELIRDLDIFALFSRWEGLPLTIIEAMLAACPVVARATGGVGELVVHNKTGLLIDELDAGKAERGLRKLICAKDRRVSMGTAGRERAVKLFSLQEMVKNYMDLYCISNTNNPLFS